MSILFFQYDETIYLNVVLGRFFQIERLVLVIQYYSNSRIYFVTIISIWILQSIVYGGSFFIETDSGEGLHNMWTGSSCV